jgi:hypothetical protein
MLFHKSTGLLRRIDEPRVNGLSALLLQGSMTMKNPQQRETVFRLYPLLEKQHDKNYYARRVFLGRIAEQYLLKQGLKLTRSKT